ncbi:glycosyltransferase [Rhodobacterales bacterium HKCCE2091]|nr:glycosyltransferase [Rhodobacterales bacterium HKCCE2091]
MDAPDPATLDVLAPNFKRRLSGVTATVVRLVPLQAREIAIAAVAPEMPPHVPRIAPAACITMPRGGPSGARVWHARRNTEMLAGLALRHLLGKRLKLLFTSASQRRHTRYSKWLIARMDRVIATSAKSARYLDRPADVILHGIDTDGFSPADDKAALKARMGLPPGPLIGCYGRIRAQKGTGVFVEAMIGTLRDRPDATAIVMGRATDKHRAFAAELHRRANVEGLGDRILFRPEVPVHEIADWYRVLDVFVAPQLWEGFGLTPLEAMACGVPVIATRVGAFEELVADGTTGTLVEPGRPGPIAAAAARLLDDPALRETLSRAARDHVVSGFRIEGEAAALVRIYREMLAAP